MVLAISSLLVLAVGYLFGSIPTGYLVGRLLKGIDIREHGSKSTGATNVLRTLGARPAVIVLLIDVLKGFGAVLVGLFLYVSISTFSNTNPSEALDMRSFDPWVVCCAGLAAIIGHGRPVWLNFRGGKSAATGLGVLLAMSWPVGLGAATIFGITLAIFRIVSLSSMLAASTAVVLVICLEQPLPFRLLVIVGAIYVIVRHQTNIQRLLKGEEPKIGKLGPEKQNTPPV